jgi:hypothetical protein
MTTAASNFRVPDLPLADVLYRVPVEGSLEDDDGVTIHFGLHVLEGVVNELEVFREDSKPVLRRRIDPAELRLLIL